MAATLTSFAMTPSYNNQCGEPDLESFLDFSQMPSPTPRLKSSPSNTASPSSTIVPLDGEDLQTPAKPSHEYERFKQQTGLPSNSVPGLSQQFSPSYHHGFSGTGLDEMSLMGSSSMLDPGWNSGLGMGSDVNMDLDLSMPSMAPAFFYPSGDSVHDDFVDPSAISSQEDTMASVRVWPGMHQQQAAIQKAQQQAQQQRAQQLAQQKAQQQQAAQQLQPTRLQPARRNGSQQVTDPRTEETITRVVNRIRMESTLQSQESISPPGSFTHIQRSKKEEEDMDADERLLASEEGKKLSSKERRQLRNKVSARAFRSRRKEYIVQLEEQLNAKQKETDDLRFQNRALMEENRNFRNLTENLLRHKAFVPYLDDIARDQAGDVKPAPQASSHTPTPQPTRKDVNPYSSQQFQDVSQSENHQIGMALIPETPLDMSMLNLGNNWNMPTANFNYQAPQIYSVTELPEGPAAPIDIDILSGKGGDSFLSESRQVDEVKPDYPVIERPVELKEATEVTAVEEEEDDDDEFDLYRAAPARKSAPSVAATLENSEPIFGSADPEKVFAHFELFVSDDAQSEKLMERFERMCARLEPCYQRLEAMTAYLDS